VSSELCATVPCMSLSRSRARGNDVRVPSPKQGTALVVERYSAENVKAVVLHPEDFSELERLSTALDELAHPPRTDLSDIGAKAHRIVESSEAELVEDEESVRRLLGL